jgi:hypothetical protein
MATAAEAGRSDGRRRRRHPAAPALAARADRPRHRRRGRDEPRRGVVRDRPRRHHLLRATKPTTRHRVAVAASDPLLLLCGCSPASAPTDTGLAPTHRQHPPARRGRGPCGKRLPDGLPDGRQRRRVTSPNGCLRDQGASMRHQDASVKRRDASLMRRDASLMRQDASPRRQDASLMRQDASLTRHDASLTRHDASLRRHDASLTRQDASLRRHDASLMRQDASLTRQDASPTRRRCFRKPQDRRHADTRCVDRLARAL